MNIVIAPNSLAIKPKFHTIRLQTTKDSYVLLKAISRIKMKESTGVLIANNCFIPFNRYNHTCLRTKLNSKKEVPL